MGLPWNRVVSESGVLNRTKRGRGEEQRIALEAEGVIVTSGGTVENLAAITWLPESRHAELDDATDRRLVPDRGATESLHLNRNRFCRRPAVR